MTFKCQANHAASKNFGTFKSRPLNTRWPLYTMRLINGPTIKVFTLTIFHNCILTKMSIKNWKLAPRFLNTPYTGSSTFKLKCSRDVKFSSWKGAYFYCLKFLRLKHIFKKEESGPCFVKFHMRQTFFEQFSPSIWQTFVLGERDKKLAFNNIERML